MKNKKIKLKETKERLITPSGLMLVGALLKKTFIGKMLDRLGKPREVKHQNSSCVISYIGLLCQGKTGYEDIREMQEDPDFCCQALQINTVPSAETLRQRIDHLAPEIIKSDIIMNASITMLKSAGLKPSPNFTEHIPLDVDVSPHDNSKTKKEGIGRTYKGIDGYAPIYAYIGEEGYVCNVELRKGESHSQCAGTVEFLKDTLRLAKKTTDQKLLVRMDSGNDAMDNIKLFIKEEVDFLIKRNIRQESPDMWLNIAKEEVLKKRAMKSEPRDGKTVYTGSIYRDKGLEKPLRIVFQITERTILANGQVLIEPKLHINTWWTNVETVEKEALPENDVIRLYHEHATCEQFHSEIKSDIGLERFPSGKFDTNATILKLAALAYNVLRVVGQCSLRLNKKLTRHDVKRLRAKTIIGRFMLIAGHVIPHARQTFLSLGRSNIWRETFTKLYTSFG